MLLPHIPPDSCIYSLGWGLLRELPPPAAALGSTEGGERRVSQTLQVLWSKVKCSWDYSRERRMWGKSCRSVVKSLIAVRHSVLESSFCAGFGDLDLSGNQKVERAVSLWLLIC